MAKGGRESKMPGYGQLSIGPPLQEKDRSMHPEMPGNKYFSSFGQLWVIQPAPLLSTGLSRGQVTQPNQMNFQKGSKRQLTPTPQPSEWPPISGNHMHAFHTVWPSCLLAYI